MPSFRMTSRNFVFGGWRYFETVLMCPNCNTEREEVRGLAQVGRQLQEIWYIGCECPTPAGVFKL